MLADRQTYRWEIEHLPCLLALKLPVTEIATTILTARRDMPDDLIRVLHSLQITTLMIGLPARFAARRAAQAFRCRRL